MTMDKGGFQHDLQDPKGPSSLPPIESPDWKQKALAGLKGTTFVEGQRKLSPRTTLPPKLPVPTRTEGEVEEELLEEIDPDGNVVTPGPIEEELLEEIDPDGNIVTPALPAKEPPAKEPPAKEPPAKEPPAPKRTKPKLPPRSRKKTPPKLPPRQRKPALPAPGSQQETAPKKTKPKLPPRERKPAPQVSAPNLVAADRLERGATALGDVSGRVRTAGQTSSGKKYDHAGVAKEYDQASGQLREEAGRVGALTQRAPESTLPKAAVGVAKAAGKARGRVEPPFVVQAQDVAIAVERGDAALLERLRERNEDLSAVVKQGKVLGKGAYGMVTRGSYLGAYPVAVKVPLSDEAEKSVAQEGALMHDVHSPHTVGALGRFTTRGKLGYVMALAQKGDVESLQKEIAAIPDPTERLNVIRHLARGGFEGLRDLHQRGRVHGDVKDGNLLLDDGYEARLTDFGASAEATQGQTTGTGAYMAPRLGAGLERNGPAADVWSMGETILHLLLGVTSTALAPKDMVPSPETQQARRKDQATKLQPEALEKHAKKLETRDDRLWDGRWFANLEKEIAKLKGLPAEDGRDLLDFLRKVMAYQPGDRLGAKSALEHKFLDKKKAALGKAQMPQLVARRDAKKKK